MDKEIRFNVPYITGKETKYMSEVISKRRLSGNGEYTKKCQKYFEERYNIKKALLTTSCTDALEMCAILSKIKKGDEVIVPSYTFVSTALAFVREGAKIVFADSRPDHPGIDEDKIEKLITPKTKAIVIVHYAGVACNMDKIMNLAEKHGVLVIEDAAQAINSYYKDKPLGSIGHLSTFSFHETKNITSGEGGLLGINDDRFFKRSEIVWEKGTNRVDFFRGEINKYGWIDVGSSFLPSEITAAFLWAQLEELDTIQKKRLSIWEKYDKSLKDWGKKIKISTPCIPDYATNNAHLYYLVCKNNSQRKRIISNLKQKKIKAVFHYLSLHKSKYYSQKFTEEKPLLINADKYTDCLVRLPLYAGMEEYKIEKVISALKNSFHE